MKKMKVVSMVTIAIITLLFVSTTAIGDPADSIVVDQSGNVGIGTTVPNEKLEVNGNAVVTGTLRADTITDTSGGKGWMPSGSIVQTQIYQNAISNGGSIGTSSTAYITWGTVAITPSSASNSILVEFNSSSVHVNSTTAGVIWILCERKIGAGSYVAIPSGVDPLLRQSMASGWGNNSASFVIVDSPATTEAVTYRVSYKVGNGTGTVYIQNGDSVAILIAKELTQ